MNCVVSGFFFEDNVFAGGPLAVEHERELVLLAEDLGAYGVLGRGEIFWELVGLGLVIEIGAAGRAQGHVDPIVDDLVRPLLSESETYRIPNRVILVPHGDLYPVVGDPSACAAVIRQLESHAV